MKYPEAHYGIKKVYTAEILTLLSAVLVLIGCSIAIAGMQGGVAGQLSEGVTAGSVLGGGALLLAAGILSLIALILNLIGLHSAAKDEKNLKTAFAMALIALIAALVSSSLSVAGSQGLLGSFIDELSSIFSLIVVFYVIQGVMNLAASLNDTRMQARGKTVTALILICLAASLVFDIIQHFTGSGAMTAVTGICALLAALTAIVGYILYLSFLKKAIRMLEQ